MHADHLHHSQATSDKLVLDFQLYRAGELTKPRDDDADLLDHCQAMSGSFVLSQFVTLAKYEGIPGPQAQT